MKRSIVYLPTACLLVTILLWACRKEAPEEQAPSNSSPELVSVQAEYYPLEVALYDLYGASVADGVYSGDFNGQSINVSVTGEIVAFLVPAVNEGTYGVSMSLGSAGSFSINCAVRPAPIPLAAEQYVSNVLNSMTQMSQSLGVLLDSLDTTPEIALLAHDNARFLEFADSVQNVVTSASVTEKQEFARIMAANEHYLVELNAEVDGLLAAASQTHRAFVVDRETEWTVAAGVFVNSTARAILRAGAVVAILNVSIATSSVGVGVVGLLGAALLISDIMDDVEAAAAACERLLNISILPHLQMDVDAENFQSGQDGLIVVEATYRTLYLGDATAPSSNFIQRFISSYQNFRQRFTSFVSSIPSSIRPVFEMSELGNGFTDAVRAVHTSWLQVSSITSSPDVTVQKIANSEGSTSLRFTNTSVEERTVNYTVTYSNPDLTSFSTTLSATVSAAGDVQPVSLAGHTYSVVSWRFTSTPGFVNTATCNNPPNLGWYQKTVTFDASSYMMEIWNEDGTSSVGGPYPYSIGAYSPDSLFLTYDPPSPLWDCTNSYGHYYTEGWGVKIPPGFALNWGTETNDVWPTRLSIDGFQIYRAQTGDEVYNRQ